MDDSFERFDYPYTPARPLREKGSLLLRSERAQYSRNVFNTGWNDARLQEPKDSDLCLRPRRDVFVSTYFRLPPSKSYGEMMDEPSVRRREVTEQEWKKSIINKNNFELSVLDGRKTHHPSAGWGEFLGRHPPDHGKGRYFTSQADHFRSPFPLLPGREVVEPVIDQDMANRRMLSQFTDCFNHRRSGRNHFLDESGVYFNSHCKLVAPYYSRKVPPFRVEHL